MNPALEGGSVSGWRHHVVALRADRCPDVDSANSAERCVPSIAAKAVGAIGAIGIEQEPASAIAARAAFLLRFAERAYAALASRDLEPIEDEERAAVFGGAGAAPRHGMAVTQGDFAGKDTTP